MKRPPLAIIPLKDFGLAKRRLNLPHGVREELARAVARHVVDACRGAGFDALVVTGSPDVGAWAAAIGAESADEPAGGGLDGAAELGMGTAVDRSVPWVVVHGDLPLLSTDDLGPLSSALSVGRVVVAPSRDGGTNILGATGPFSFRYGPGSFHRHLDVAAGMPTTVIVRPGTAIEIDTLPDLEAAERLGAGSWLSRFLS
ncbi:MAG TPA: 2-phospho-L-lactate guanylyltransferase [Acidimicrobiia bacterium]|nr:2-phospho-L-lactate guanylyltransferase [Acidimicrobiia bacterium]